MKSDPSGQQQAERVGLDWITALRAPAIMALVEAGELQLSLFDQRDMAAITSPDYPGERLIVCRNRDLASERRRKISPPSRTPSGRCAARTRLVSKACPPRRRIGVKKFLEVGIDL